jgi:O-antigen/teichoic acid export membrane protein
MKNYLFVNLSKITNSFIGFLTQYFLIRIFIPSEIGLIIYLSSLSTIFFYFSYLGLTNFSRRILPSLTTNLEDYYSYVGVVYFKKLVLFFFFNILFSIFNMVFSIFSNFELLLILILIFNLSSNSKFIFESRSNFVFFSLFDSFLKILSFIILILFSFVRLNNYLSYFFILNFIQLIFSIFLVFFIISKEIGRASCRERVLLAV